MKTLKEHFTPEQLRSFLEYDPVTGVLRWRVSEVLGRRKAGSIAGSLRPTGYLNISINGKNFLAHRAAWAIYFGAWPNGILDHINGQRSDNRIANLRPTTIAQNAANSGPRSNNKAGIKGIFRTPSGRWKASIRVDGCNVSLGLFDTSLEAGDAYQTAARKVFGEFALGAKDRKEVMP
jgi:hypothetical protein